MEEELNIQKPVESEQVPTNEPRQAIWQRITLPAALMIVIVLSGLIVSVAYAIYWNSEDRKYDLARGGDETKNQALNVEDTDATDRTSPVDAPAAQKKLEYLQSEIRALGGLGKFESSDLSDQNLQLTEPDPASF